MSAAVELNPMAMAQKKEGVEVHSVARESENAFPHERQFAVSRVEVVGTGSPNHSEVSLDAVDGVDTEEGEDNCCDCLRQNWEFKTTMVHPSQCQQRNEASAK